MIVIIVEDFFNEIPIMESLSKLTIMYIFLIISVVSYFGGLYYERLEKK